MSDENDFEIDNEVWEDDATNFGIGERTLQRDRERALAPQRAAAERERIINIVRDIKPSWMTDGAGVRGNSPAISIVQARLGDATSGRAVSEEQ